MPINSVQIKNINELAESHVHGAIHLAKARLTTATAGLLEAKTAAWVKAHCTSFNRSLAVNDKKTEKLKEKHAKEMTVLRNRHLVEMTVLTKENETIIEKAKEKGITWRNASRNYCSAINGYIHTAEGLGPDINIKFGLNNQTEADMSEIAGNIRDLLDEYQRLTMESWSNETQEEIRGFVVAVQNLKRDARAILPIKFVTIQDI